MKRSDFLRLAGADEGAEYAPVAGMLESGYGFAGYFNSRLNEGLDDTCVLMNARLVDLRGAEEEPSYRPRISDFNDFVEEIVRQSYQSEETPQRPRDDAYGRSIPLAAIPFGQIAVVYPVSHIAKMMADLERERKKVPAFFDLDNKSIILKLLRTKLW